MRVGFQQAARQSPVRANCDPRHIEAWRESDRRHGEAEGNRLHGRNFRPVAALSPLLLIASTIANTSGGEPYEIAVPDPRVEMGNCSTSGTACSLSTT